MQDVISCFRCPEMGFEMESSYHSNEVCQHHIDFKFDDGIQTADNIMTFKLTVRTVAKRHGLHATFMPKAKLWEKRFCDVL